MRLFPKDRWQLIDILFLWPLGFGLASFVMFVASLIFHSFFIGEIGVLVLAAIGVYFIVSFLDSTKAYLIKRGHKTDIFLGLLSVLVGILVLSYWLKLPLCGFDSWALWGMKAKMCFFNAALPLKDFQGKVFLQFVPKPSYPLNLVLNETLLSTLLGAFKGPPLKIISFVFGAVSVFILYLYLREHIAPYRSFLVAFVFMFTPMFVLHTCGFYAGYSDIIVLCYNMAAAIMLCKFYVKGHKRYLYLSAILVGLAFWTKLEGGILLVSYIAAIAYMFRGFKGMRLAAVYLGLVLLISCVWGVVLFSSRMLYTGHHIDIGLLGQRILLMAKATVKEGLTIYKWHLFWPVLFGVLVLGTKRKNSAPYRFFRFIFLFQFFTYVLILILHYRLFDFLRFYPSLPLDRLWLHTFGIACIVLGLSWKEVQSGAINHVPKS